MESQGIDVKERVTAATIHSLAFEHMQYKKPYMVNTLYQFAQSIGQRSGVRDDRNLHLARTPLEKAIAYYQVQRSLMVSPDLHVPEGMDMDVIQEYIDDFEKYKHENNYLDYNDVLINYLNEGEPLTYDVAFIDEAQDLSPLQWAVVEKMFGGCHDIIAVGDDDQTIFAFAGVRPEMFIEWPCDEVIVLGQTHRFGQEVLTFSEHVLDRIESRIPKKYVPSTRKSKVSITNAIVPDLDIFPYKSVAILHRNRYLVKKTQKMLNDLGVTYAGSGSPFVSQSQMKAVRRWEEWREGAEFQAYHVHSIARYVPQSIPFDRMEDVGKRTLAGPCPYPDRPWHEILAIPYHEIYLNVQNMHSFEYLIRKPIITATTIHQSKGGEWDKVIVITDMSAATYLDFKRGVDEDTEHRVWFVAATRAIEHLQIIKPTTPKFYPYEGVAYDEVSTPSDDLSDVVVVRAANEGRVTKAKEHGEDALARGGERVS
jgi:superfamily I DNA/RNA helicase